jgi:hypothetical protein
MKILVACEFSGRVRDAFTRRGFDAWSCDILPSETPGKHIQGDVRKILNDGWDLMIAHPPCTYLSYAGLRYWNVPGRKELRQEAMQFFMEMVNAPIEKICVENPVGYPNTVYRKPDQVIHPYYFGDPFLKKTCLWLKNLPKLWYWKIDDLFGKQTMSEFPEPIYATPRSDGTTKLRHFTEAMHGKERSITFPGIADAMAEQWGRLLK